MMTRTLQLDIYSHHFILSGVDSFYDKVIQEFARKLVEVKVERDRWGNVRGESIHVYAVRHKFDLAYRFHINHLYELDEHFKNRGLDLPTPTKKPLYKPLEANFEVKKGWSPRDDQKHVVEYMVKPGTKKVVDAQTGSGKTIMTLFAVTAINQRVALVLKPMYTSRWLDVLVGDDKFFSDKVKNKDIMTVRGSAQMASLINLALADELDSSFIIISNRTYINYLNHYKENGPSEEYGWVKPENLWETLGVGVRLIDEAHQDFFGCFLTDLHSHVPKSIELSGSLNPDDAFLSKMYEVMYPKELRMNTGATKRYADMIALYYSLDQTRKRLSTTRRGRSSYSQAAYEESILKSTVALRRLKDMMHYACEEFFMSERIGDNKLLVFFDTVNMCAEIADTFQEIYPDLFVSKYTQEEDPSVLDEADIIIATPASAGTAVDIDGLQQVHSFVLRNSSQALIQMFGRLRQLATKEVTPKYYYFMTNDITAHQRYHQKALQVFQFRAKTHTNRILPHVI